MLRALVLSLAAATASAAAINWNRVFDRLPRLNASDAAPSSGATPPVGTYRNCGSSSDTAKNLVISIVPDSPKAGQEVVTIFKYDLSKEITGGTASYGFSFNGIPFSPTVDDLCTDQAGGCCPDPCPLAVGPHENESHSDFPSGVSGKIVTCVRAAAVPPQRPSGFCARARARRARSPRRSAPRSTIKWKDQDNAQILCVEWTVKA